MQYFVTSLEIPLEALCQAKDGLTGNESMLDVVKFDFNAALEVLESHLQFKTFMVGHSITVADISGCSALHKALSFQLWDTENEKLTNVNRWFQTVTHQTFFEESVSVLPSPFSSQSTSTISSKTSGSDGVCLSGVAPGVVPKLYNRQRIRVKELMSSTSYIGQSVTVAGWARTTRNANKGQLLFLELNDGSCGTSLQCVLENGITENFDEAKGAGGTGASYWIVGDIVESPAQGQVRILEITKVYSLYETYQF